MFVLKSLKDRYDRINLNIREKVKEIYNKTRFRIFLSVVKFRPLIIRSWNILKNILSKIFLTLISILICFVILILPEFRETLEKIQSIQSVLITLGSTYGTIIALVFSLSIIPIQRAGEAWSRSIVRLYRLDIPTFLIFICLGFVCIVSFLFSMDGLLGIPVYLVFLGGVVLLGFTLDLLRWYREYLCILLDPEHAIKQIENRSYKIIDKLQKKTSKLAALQYELLREDNRKGISKENIEGVIYGQIPEYPGVINFWIQDAVEIATKATLKGEKYLSRIAINTICNITNYSITTRKDNIILLPSPDASFLVSEPDIKVVLNQSYESLFEINQIAINNGNESIALEIINGFCLIAVHTVNLKSKSFRSNSAPMTARPIGYLFNCIKYAQDKGYEEVPFQGIEIVARISVSAPKDATITDIHIPIVDGIFNVVSQFYIKNKQTSAEYTVGYMIKILFSLLERQDYYFKELLEYILEKINKLALYAILSEQIVGKQHLSSPLKKVYSLANPHSLGTLFGTATNHIELNEKNKRQDPYYDFLKVMNAYGNHLRKIGEEIEFGDSFLLWELIQLIKHISLVTAGLIKSPIRVGCQRS